MCGRYFVRSTSFFSTKINFWNSVKYKMWFFVKISITSANLQYFTWSRFTFTNSYFHDVMLWFLVWRLVFTNCRWSSAVWRQLWQHCQVLWFLCLPSVLAFPSLALKFALRVSLQIHTCKSEVKCSRLIFWQKLSTGLIFAGEILGAKTEVKVFNQHLALCFIASG